MDKLKTQIASRRIKVDRKKKLDVIQEEKNEGSERDIDSSSESGEDVENSKNND